MGLNECVKHGVSTGFYTCRHLADSIYGRQQALPRDDIAKINDGKDGPAQMGRDVMSFWVCADCLRKWEAIRFPPSIDKHSFLEIPAADDLVPMCRACFTERYGTE